MMRFALSSAHTPCVSKPSTTLTTRRSTFAQWIRGQREEGVDLRLCALEPHVHHLLEEIGEAGDALMPLAEAINETPRRKIDALKLSS